MNYVRLANGHNSTMFTTCCEVAILDTQSRCPHCAEEVFPGDGYKENEVRKMRWQHAYVRVGGKA